MSIAALYDIHGNLPALRAVLADAATAGVDSFVIGGDVADGPMPAETIEQLLALGERARYVRGNSDREVVEAYDHVAAKPNGDVDAAQPAVAFAAASISRGQRDFLDRFDATVKLEVDGLGSVLFCHGSPHSDVDIITRLTSDTRLRSMLQGVDSDVVVGGHVHQQYDRPIDRWRVVNPGSVGMPYEGRAGAYWALLGPGVELRRSEYELSELNASALPQLQELLSESLFDPADPAWVTELFERQAAIDTS